MKITKKAGKLPRFQNQGRMYGTSTVGSRGQIVIPAKARQDFGLETGSQLFIVGNNSAGMLGLVRAENLNEFVDKMIKHLTDMGADQGLKNKVLKLLEHAVKK